MFKSKSDESHFFAIWLSNQNDPSIIFTQVESVKNVLDRLDTGDLVCVLYHGKPDTASKALEILKERHAKEMKTWDEQDDDLQAAEWLSHGDGYDADSWH